ncbi:hypothetical protein KKH3_10520 [Pectobacterium actinidiae]|nr:hypothetical protein KKH3_10520 [Pectobacterium actinidiae]
MPISLYFRLFLPFFWRIVANLRNSSQSIAHKSEIFLSRALGVVARVAYGYAMRIFCYESEQATHVAILH